MGRPQQIDIEQLLDHARALWVENGQSAVTIRALSTRSGVSNGAIYHHFSSRSHLLAKIWAREAAAFFAFQRAEVDRALSSGTGADGAVAAALATGAYAEVDSQAVRVLMASRPDLVSGDGVPEELLDQLRSYRRKAGELIEDLTDRAWGSRSELARTVMRQAVVDIPARIFTGSKVPNDPVARHTIEHAVRGVVAAGLPG
jgi:AcrR family transcriptional regulator